MSVPVIYYGNALLSGTLSGTNDTAATPLRRVRDGSITLPYPLAVSGAGARTEAVTLTSVSAIQPDTLVIPKCSLSSGAVLRVYMASAAGGADVNYLVSATLPADTTSYMVDLGATSGNKHWTVDITVGAAQPLVQTVNEIALARKYTLPRSPSVDVRRTRVRQFERTPLPGDQPFTRRQGPVLRRVEYDFIVVSGAELNKLNTLAAGLEGGSAFNFTDDIAETYWAELVQGDITQGDTAGVYGVSLAFQEIGVE